MKKNTVKEFSELMQEAYLGTVKWPNGDKPVYRRIGEFLFIADSCCVNAHECDDPDTWWDLDMQFPTQKGAKAFLRALPTSAFHPDDFGFVRDGSSEVSRRDSTNEADRAAARITAAVKDLNRIVMNLHRRIFDLEMPTVTKG